MSFFKDLRIPVNPAYDFDSDPADQHEYVNPVTANNKEILLANAALRVGQRVTRINREIAKQKYALRTAKAELEDFERDLLIRYPPKAGATKSLKLTDAYLASLIVDQGAQEEVARMKARILEAERELLILEADLDSAKMVFQTIKLAGEHVQTHLSFVKAEMRGVS